MKDYDASMRVRDILRKTRAATLRKPNQFVAFKVGFERMDNSPDVM